jgi:nucleoside-diphosphate-sugar epimerase
MTRTLITGAGGFVGRHCLSALADRSTEVHATTTRTTLNRRTGCIWHSCNLLDSQSTARLIDSIRPTHLLHLAWITTPTTYWESPLNDSWHAATTKLVEYFISRGGERIMVAGTCAEYAQGLEPCRESECGAKPATRYAAAKSTLREDLSQIANDSHIGFAWPRLFYMYGPGEHPSRLVPSIVLSLLRDEPALCTSGRQRRDYLHVADVARALIQILFSTVTGAINVGSGRATLLAEIAQMIALRMNKPKLLKLGAKVDQVGEPPVIVADVERLWNEVGFSPRIRLEEGLKHTIQWWKAQEMIIATHETAYAQGTFAI